MDARRDVKAAHVTVVMAVWHGDQPDHVDAAIRSVLTQTHGLLDVLIVKNGPVSWAVNDVINQHRAADPRARILELAENVGPARARNHAIEHATGEFIAILDADDIAEPTRLERQLHFLAEHSADLIGSAYFVIDDRGNITATKHVPLSPKAIRNAMVLFNPICNSTVLARTDVLKQQPYPDTTTRGITFGEDFALWVELARSGYVLRNTGEHLVRFRASSSFLRRRSGWVMFRTDLRTKWRALALQPAPLRPFLAIVATLSAAARLLPSPLLQTLYRIRNRFRFGMR